MPVMLIRQFFCLRVRKVVTFNQYFAYLHTVLKILNVIILMNSEITVYSVIKVSSKNLVRGLCSSPLPTLTLLIHFGGKASCQFM